MARFEKFTQPSKTIQEHDVPLKTLLQRYSRGSSVQTFNPIFQLAEDGDGAYIPEVEKMDTIQRIELSRQLKRKIKVTRQNLLAKKAAKEIKDKDKSLYVEIIDGLKQLTAFGKDTKKVSEVAVDKADKKDPPPAKAVKKS